MNEKKHWNKIGNKYEGEIFDVFKSDLNKKIPACIGRHANKNYTALDFGCGTGRAFPLLIKNFRKVYGLDISDRLLTEANATRFANVTLQQADLTQPKANLPNVDFLFSSNVIMLPRPEQNRAMLKNVHRALRHGGTAVIIVPSLDSVLHASQQLIRWYEKEGTSIEKINRAEFAYYKNIRNILSGIIHIDGVPTKHYTHAELLLFFEEAGLSVLNIDKVEYGWHTEFDSPPRWMKAPYPWDWLVECKKD